MLDIPDWWHIWCLRYFWRAHTLYWSCQKVRNKTLLGYIYYITLKKFFLLFVKNIFISSISSFDLISRWDTNVTDTLPAYMKFIHNKLLGVYNEAEEELAKQGRSYGIPYAKQTVGRLSCNLLKIKKLDSSLIICFLFWYFYKFMIGIYYTHTYTNTHTHDDVEQLF